MTREEAIKRFETLLHHVDTDCVMGMETTEAINMAIKALKQPELREDAVSREDMLAELDEWRDSFDEIGHKESCADMKLVRKTMALLPSARPVPKRGKWVKEYWNGEHTRKCSVCNITQTVTTYEGKVNFNYCPYCGAKMER